MKEIKEPKKGKIVLRPLEKEDVVLERPVYWDGCPSRVKCWNLRGPYGKNEDYRMITPFWNSHRAQTAYITELSKICIEFEEWGPLDWDGTDLSKYYYFEIDEEDYRSASRRIGQEVEFMTDKEGKIVILKYEDVGPKPELAPKDERVKKIACDFFYHWYNAKGGTNTEEAFDEWWEKNKTNY